MNSSSPQLSLVIPALNERKIIVPNVIELTTWMSRNLPNTSYEIVVVNDGSTDGMDKLLKEESNKLSHLRILEHTVNMGRGRAVRTAMENTSGDYLIVLDADFSYGPEHITALLQPL